MVASTLRGSEVVGAAHLGLASTDAETVQATLLAVRDRWLSGSGDTPKVDDTAALLAEISSSFDDAETQPEEY
jgi:hypothetical protein